MHFTPTYSFWMNLVERFFAELTQDVVRSGSFQSVGQLVNSIETYLAVRNDDPKNPTGGKQKVKKYLPKSKEARDTLTTVS